MVGIGVVLVVLGLLFPHFAVLVTVGLLLVVVGLVLNFVPMGGRRYRVW